MFFELSTLRLIRIPRSVEILGKSCSANATVGTLTFEGVSRLTQIEDECFSFCPLKSICIPRSVEVVGKSCFSAANISAVEFESESRLTRFEEGCFKLSGLKSIIIPKDVTSISETALSGTYLESIIVQDGNKRFGTEGKFFIDLVEAKVIRFYAVTRRSAVVPNTIRILGSCCFSWTQMESLGFESECQVKQIEESCFTQSSLKAICIPRSVEVIGKRAFSRCRGLEVLTFETQSKLKRLDDECFASCAFKSICIPGSIEIIGKSCFSSCELLIDVTFETGSQLKVIDDNCFDGCPVRSIQLPHGIRVGANALPQPGQQQKTQQGIPERTAGTRGPQRRRAARDEP
jgi:hypothetical protein